MRFSKTIPNTVTVTASDVHSQVITLTQDYGYAAQAVWSGTLVGTIKLQATIDGTTWSDVAGSSQAVTSGSGSFLWNVNGAFYDSVRVYFTRASGTGSIVFNFETKGP